MLIGQPYPDTGENFPVRKWKDGNGDKLFEQISLENESVFKWTFNWPSSSLNIPFVGGLCNHKTHFELATVRS